MPISFAACRPLRALVIALIACGGWVAVWWGTAQAAGRIPGPFVWPDIALVSVFVWIPVGLVVADSLLRVSRMLAFLLAGLALFVSFLLFWDLPGVTTFPVAWLSRLLWGGMIGISIAILAGFRNLVLDANRPPIWPVWSLALLIPLMGIASASYSADRTRYYKEQTQDLLGQGRYHEACQLVLRLLTLDPDGKIDQHPLAMLAADLHLQLKDLRQDAASIQERLAENARLSSSDRLELRIRLAEDWMMLGQAGQAIAEARTITQEHRHSAAAWNLLATLLEYEERWQESLQSYEKARELLSQDEPPPGQTQELVRAWKGIAYTQRKLSHYREAEAAYFQVLEHAPTAENHFLMAQFYDNAQQGEQAQHHAEIAASLKPETFRERADSMVRDMQSKHFGCWTIFQNRGS